MITLITRLHRLHDYMITLITRLHRLHDYTDYMITLMTRLLFYMIYSRLVKPVTLKGPHWLNSEKIKKAVHLQLPACLYDYIIT